MTTAVEVAEKGHQLAAWVNFKGTLAMTVGSSYGPDAPPADYSSPNPIRAAYNVDYIIDLGTGYYEIHFENEMPDANYSVVGMCSGTGSPNRALAHAQDTTVVNGSVRVKSFSTSGNVLTDEASINVAIFR